MTFLDISPKYAFLFFLTVGWICLFSNYLSYATYDAIWLFQNTSQYLKVMFILTENTQNPFIGVHVMPLCMYTVSYQFEYKNEPWYQNSGYPAELELVTRRKLETWVL